MSILTQVLGWQAFGIGVRMYQLGIQKRRVTDAPHIYGYVLAVWGVVGYGVFHARERQTTLLAQKRRSLTEIREKEQAAYEAGKSSQPA